MTHFARCHRRAGLLRRNLLLEGLGPRYLLAGITVELRDGIASVSGSAADDEIVIAPMLQRDEVHVFANGQCISAWPRSDVHEIDVQSLAGDDLIRVADAVTVPVKVTGGDGIDTVLSELSEEQRHCWTLDVEQVMAEGEFTAPSGGGQDEHAGHAGHLASSAAGAIQLAPIPTDHVHVEPIVTILPTDNTAVQQSGTAAAPPTLHEHSTSTDTAAISPAQPNLFSETPSPDSVAASAHEASHLDHAGGIAVAASGITALSPLSMTSPGSSIDHSAHAGHGASSVAMGAPAEDHSGHAAFAGSASVLGADHSGHAGHGVSAIAAGNGHSAHAYGMNAVGQGHGDGAASAVHADHAAHVQDANASDLGIAAAHESGHPGHESKDGGPLYGVTGHDHVARWRAGSTAFATLTSDAHAEARCHATHGATPFVGGGERSERLAPDVLSTSVLVPDCHASRHALQSDSTGDASSAAARRPGDDTCPLAPREVHVGDRSMSMRSAFTWLLAAVGTLLSIWAVRHRRSSRLADDATELSSRLAIEWLGGRGCPY